MLWLCSIRSCRLCRRQREGRDGRGQSATTGKQTRVAGLLSERGFGHADVMNKIHFQYYKKAENTCVKHIQFASSYYKNFANSAVLQTSALTTQFNSFVSFFTSTILTFHSLRKTIFYLFLLIINCHASFISNISSVPTEDLGQNITYMIFE